MIFHLTCSATDKSEGQETDLENSPIPYPFRYKNPSFDRVPAFASNFLLFQVVQNYVKQKTTNMTGPTYDIKIFCITIKHKSSCNTRTFYCIFPQIQNGYSLLHDDKSNGRTMDTLASLDKHTQNVSINMQETLMFICM